jgi:hypothetical protein
MKTETMQNLTHDQRARCFFNWATLHFNQRNRQFLELFEHCLCNASTFGNGIFYRFNGGEACGYNDDLVMTELEQGNHFQLFHTWRQASVYARGLAKLRHMAKVQDFLELLARYLERVDSFSDEDKDEHGNIEVAIATMFFVIFLALASDEEQEEALQYA